MKNMRLLPVTMVALLMSSCSGVMEMKKIDMVQVGQFQDSLLQGQIIPGVNSVHTLQDDDYSKVTIIVTDKRLYPNNDKIQEAAIRTGMMILRVLGPDNNISKATFAVSNTQSDKDEIPADGIKADMKIDSLKKVLYPGK